MSNRDPYSDYDPTLSPHRHTADTEHAKASAAKASFKRAWGKFAATLSPKQLESSAYGGVSPSAGAHTNYVRLHPIRAMRGMAIKATA